VTSTIALVDDDRNILTSVSMALEAEGFAVRCYSDGAEALRGMTAQPVDLAVLDIKMPRMDGMEILGQLRRQSHIPVIFLTSKDDEVDELLGLRMGADDYIKKTPGAAAELYAAALKQQGISAEELSDMIGDPDVAYRAAPAGVLRLDQFMQRIGRLKRAAARWQELFLPAARDLKGD